MVIWSASSKWTPRKFLPAELAAEAGGEGADQRHRPLLDRQQLEHAARPAVEIARQQQLFERGHGEQRKAPAERAVLVAHRHVERLRIGRQEIRLDPEQHLEQQRHRSEPVGKAIGQAQRIDFVAAIEHRVGEARAAEEHADHRLDRRPRRGEARSARARRYRAQGRSGRSPAAARAPRSDRPAAQGRAR